MFTAQNNICHMFMTIITWFHIYCTEQYYDYLRKCCFCKMFLWVKLIQYRCNVKVHDLNFFSLRNTSFTRRRLSVESACVFVSSFVIHWWVQFPSSFPNYTTWQFVGMGCRSIGRALNCHAADAGSIPPVWQGIFFPESTFSADSLLTSIHPPVCNRTH